MATRKPKRKPVSDPVLTTQGGRQMPLDPGGSVREDAIRNRAYELFERRGCMHGHDLQDWLDAEAQVTEKGA